MVFTIIASVSAWRAFAEDFQGAIVWQSADLRGESNYLSPRPICNCNDHPVFNVRDLVANFTRYGQHELACELEELARNEGFNAIEVEASSLKHRIFATK